MKHEIEGMDLALNELFIKAMIVDRLLEAERTMRIYECPDGSTIAIEKSVAGLHFFFRGPVKADPEEDELVEPEPMVSCTGCGQPFYEEDLNEISPGTWLCVSCEADLVEPERAVAEGFVLENRAVEGGGKGVEATPGAKPLRTAGPRRLTADDVNRAIQLLLWRCRDAEFNKDSPQGKGGVLGLDDWISRAEDIMIKELGLWCADIQQLNIGTRDS